MVRSPSVRPTLRLAGQLGCVAALLAATSCGESVDPLVERLAAAPLPDGAVEVASENRDGDFERGPEASVDYTLPAPLVQACPDVLGRYLAADYTLTDYVDEPDPITDPTSWCAVELQTPDDGFPQTHVIAIAYPPDSEARYPSDGIYVTVTTEEGGDPNAGGSILRLSAG